MLYYKSCIERLEIHLFYDCGQWPNQTNLCLTCIWHTYKIETRTCPLILLEIFRV